MWDMGRGSTSDTSKFEADEMNSLQNLLHAMLTYDPSQRISAADAMESDYIVRWGRPALLKLSCTASEPKT